MLIYKSTSESDNFINIIITTIDITIMIIIIEHWNISSDGDQKKYRWINNVNLIYIFNILKFFRGFIVDNWSYLATSA